MSGIYWKVLSFHPQETNATSAGYCLWGGGGGIWQTYSLQRISRASQGGGGAKRPWSCKFLSGLDKTSFHGFWVGVTLRPDGGIKKETSFEKKDRKRRARGDQ